MITEPYSAMMTPQLKNRPGVIGCTLGHLRALLTSWENGDEYALIMEDDATATLAPWWPLSLEDFVDSLPAGWEAAQLMYNTDMWKDKTGAAKRQFHMTKKGKFV